MVKLRNSRVSSCWWGVRQGHGRLDLLYGSPYINTTIEGDCVDLSAPPLAPLLAGLMAGLTDGLIYCKNAV